jgi:aryl-alcohol dehydrogenase-like predicted oxidoreductase
MGDARGGGADEVPRRALGRTGEIVSILGLGGFHLAVPPSEQESIRILRTAVDGGITFLDHCWDHHDGESERRMGKALRDGHRDRVFLMTKVDGRTEASAARQREESLRRLETDHVDLLQLHEVIRDAEECLRYAMSLPVATVITGCDALERVEQALRVARGLRPLAEDDVSALLARTAPAAQGGADERYKTTDGYDATTHNPSWLG